MISLRGHIHRVIVLTMGRESQLAAPISLYTRKPREMAQQLLCQYTEGLLNWL